MLDRKQTKLLINAFVDVVLQFPISASPLPCVRFPDGRRFVFLDLSQRVEAYGRLLDSQLREKMQHGVHIKQEPGRERTKPIQTGVTSALGVMPRFWRACLQQGFGASSPVAVRRTSHTRQRISCIWGRAAGMHQPTARSHLLGGMITSNKRLIPSSGVASTTTSTAASVLRFLMSWRTHFVEREIRGEEVPPPL